MSLRAARALSLSSKSRQREVHADDDPFRRTPPTPVDQTDYAPGTPRDDGGQDYDEFGASGIGYEQGFQRASSVTPTASSTLASSYGPGSSGVASSSSSVYSGKTDLTTNAPLSATTSAQLPTAGSHLAAIEHFRALSIKRIATFVHLRQAHQGKTHWYNTVQLDRGTLEGGMDPVKLAQRQVSALFCPIDKRKLRREDVEPRDSPCWECPFRLSSTS